MKFEMIGKGSNGTKVYLVKNLLNNKEYAMKKVSNSIFLVAPSNYEITNEMAREEMKSKLSVSWLKNGRSYNGQGLGTIRRSRPRRNRRI